MHRLSEPSKSRILKSAGDTSTEKSSPCSGKKEEIMFHILWSIIVGFFAGLIARAVYPGANPMGLVETTLLGIGGSIVGGLIARLIWKHKPGQKFHAGGFLLSIIGALVLLFLWQRLY
jgi:uncharacterized membrane protein YeaQ/YmgE (transglycosylase-associated protein family)